MLRAFRFAIIAIILLAIAWYVASLNGHLTLEVGGYVATAPTAIAIVLLVILVGILMLILGIIRGLFRAPRRLATRRALSRRDAADAASLRALSALEAGDPADAAHHARIARRHAPDAPLTLYVVGQTARRTGDHVTADAQFISLARHKDAGFLGWRGLLHHRASNPGDAVALAETEQQARLAAAAHPHSPWLRDQRVQLAAKLGNFAEAARLATAKQPRAALAIMASRGADTDRLAIDWAREAVHDAPRLSVAHLSLFQAHQRAGNKWRAKRALERGWKAAPQPDLAAAWLTGIAPPLERARAAHKLAAFNPGHPESEILLAHTAREAGLSGEAERHDSLAGAKGISSWICTTCDTDHAEWQVACRKCGTTGSLAWVRTLPAPLTTALLPAPEPEARGEVAPPG